MTHISSLFVNNTNLLELRGLQSSIDAAYVNDATVTVTLYDEDGDAVETHTDAEQSWPTTMDYVADSDGLYRTTLSHGLELLEGETYYAHVEAVDGGGNEGHWEFAFVAKTRRAT